MLLGGKFEEIQGFAGRKVRQRRLGVLDRIHLEESVEPHDLSCRTEIVRRVCGLRLGVCRNVHSGAVEDCGWHLCREETLPNEAVEFLLARFNAAADILGRTVRVSRPDCLMRFLRALCLGLKLSRLGKRVRCAERRTNICGRSSNRFIGKVHRVGPHVRDEAGFVELLREIHGLLCGESQPAKCVLLKR